MSSNPNKQQVEGEWKQFKGRLREAWGTLTQDKLDQYKGKRDQLEGYIEKQTGENREEIRRRIDELAKRTKYNV